MRQKVDHHGPFDLRNQNDYFGGWPVVKDTDKEYAIAIVFPVEGWQESAAVILSQNKDNELFVEVSGAKNSEQAIKQALAATSLDVDDSGWQAAGSHDKFIADLQTKYQYVRPSLFHTPYEAATAFVIGQRISIKQRQAIQKKMSDQLGEKFKIEDQEFSAFPLPQALLEMNEFPGLNQTKMERLHGVAKAAMEGLLDRSKLLSMSEEAALEHLQKLDGIGPFYASGILYRGAGIVDGVTDDGMTKYALKHAYNLSEEPKQKEVLEIAENWRPYRMWCEVLIHIWLRKEVGLPKR